MCSSTPSPAAATATDASHYQIMPLGVVTPRTIEEAERTIGICRAEGVSVLPRGGGTSQSGQTVNESVVIDGSRHLNRNHRPRYRGPALRGRARHRARRSQPRAEADRAVVPGRHLDRVARHHRRHGGQQFLRRALAALRQHARERAVDRRLARRRHAGAFRTGDRRQGRSAARAGARPVGAGGARGGRDRAAISQGAAPRRRLQSRRAAAGQERRQFCAPPGRVGRARWRIRRRSS